MNKHDEEEVRNTESKLMMVLVLAILLLVIGEVVLYRNIQSVKTMISETAMQVKEGRGVKSPTPTPTKVIQQGANGK